MTRDQFVAMLTRYADDYVTQPRTAEIPTPHGAKPLSAFPSFEVPVPDVMLTFWVLEDFIEFLQSGSGKSKRERERMRARRDWRAFATSFKG